MSPIATFLREALRKGSQDVPFATADHGDAVLFMSDVAEFIDAFCGGSAFFPGFVSHGDQEVGDVLECGGFGGRWFGRGWFL